MNRVIVKDRQDENVSEESTLLPFKPVRAAVQYISPTRLLPLRPQKGGTLWFLYGFYGCRGVDHSIDSRI